MKAPAVGQVSDLTPNDQRTRLGRLKDPPTFRRAMLGAVCLWCAAARAQAPAPSAPAPAVNWVLPIFTDKEGYRSMTLRGSEVRPTGKNIAVTDLNITIFSGDEKAHVDTILLSPEAMFFPKETRASGDKAVRVIRDDVEVTGVGWTYDHATKKVSLQHNVRVTFTAQLNDILK